MYYQKDIQTPFKSMWKEATHIVHVRNLLNHESIDWLKKLWIGLELLAIVSSVSFLVFGGLLSRECRIAYFDEDMNDDEKDDVGFRFY